MNTHLLSAIVQHIFSNLGVIPSSYVNLKTTKSLMSKEYSLSESLVFEDEEGNVIKNKMWGCQLSSDIQEINILLGNCSLSKEQLEFAAVVQLKDAPAYGVYIVQDVNNESMIGVTINSKDWMECGTYLQATFLAGMEQIRDIGLAWHKCSDYQSQYKLLLSFIKYHDMMYGSTYEG